MKKISVITSDAAQRYQILLDDQTVIDFSLRYVDNLRGWFYSITYGDFSLSNQRVITGPNMLRKYRDIIPFGLCCITTDGHEPVLITDFSSGRAAFYVLNSSDVSEVEAKITS